jgi:hypothetical protein
MDGIINDSFWCSDGMKSHLFMLMVFDVHHTKMSIAWICLGSPNLQWLDKMVNFFESKAWRKMLRWNLHVSSFIYSYIYMLLAISGTFGKWFVPLPLIDPHWILLFWFKLGSFLFVRSFYVLLGVFLNGVCYSLII